MKKQLSLLLLLSGFAGVAHAQGEVYVCVDEDGRREYRNTGMTKGCKRVDLPGLSMVPAPASAPAPARAAPAAPTAAARPAAAPVDFPKVDSATQRARDTDRRRILQDEMRAEEQKLAGLKKEFNNGEPERRGDERNYAKYQERVALMQEDIRRTEKNIEALQRELNNLR
ncbi:MAG TPA: DUF4124 domain-containing protein [Noviherbaspirillum sp.]|nr:DUF4124 domain-containing protein [Noviherbaspirillum sp.]